MTVASYQIPGGARILLFSCEVCGAPALFGTDCHVLDALRTGDVKRAGRWFCGMSKDGEPACVATVHRPAEAMEGALI